MSEPFIGQVQPLAFNFAPRGWAQCNGQILSIAQNTALFALIGTMYGGNGQSTFALPDLQSRVPMHKGQLTGDGTFTQGETGGTETVTLTVSTMPGHNHGFHGTSADANSARPTDGATLAKVHELSGGTAAFYYAPDTTPQPLNPASLDMIGGNQPHDNLQPYLTINWCIALLGIFPPRS